MPRTKIQRMYIKMLSNVPNKIALQKYKRIVIYSNALKRKKSGSSNSLKNIIKLSKRIYGFEELAKQLKFTLPDFSREIDLLNSLLFDYVKVQMNRRKQNPKIFFGENLLNSYCDVIFLATNLDSNRKNNIRPKILRNPKTGKNLEYDIFFKNIKVALEFQGEQHYTNEKIIQNDMLKLNLSKMNCIMLSPINPIQMKNFALSKLIANTTKDFLKMNDCNGNLYPNVKAKYMLLFKIIQRFDLADKLYADVMKYLDEITSKYMKSIMRYSPVSTTTLAPRIVSESGDKDIAVLNRQIPKTYRAIREHKKRIVDIDVKNAPSTSSR